MFQCFNDAEIERAVAHWHHNIARNAAELLEGFVNVGFHPFVEEGVKDVVGVVEMIAYHALTAHIGTVVSAARNLMNFSAVGFNHADFCRTGVFFDINFAADARAGRIGSHGVAGVAA